MRPSFLSDSAIDTLAGRLNIRTKLLVCFASSLAAIACSNPDALALLAVVSTLYALTAMSPLGLVKSYCVIVAMCLISLAFIALLSLAMPKLIRWEAWRFAVPYLRMVVSINALLTLAFSSRIQDLMRELQAIGRLTWIYVPITVAVRFVPTFLDDCGQVMDAFRLRRPLGGRGLAAKVATLWRGFLMPLTFRLLRSADDLAVAAELKGVGSGPRSVRPGLPMTRIDALVLATAALSFVAAGCIQLVSGGSRMFG